MVLVRHARPLLLLSWLLFALVVADTFGRVDLRWRHGPTSNPAASVVHLAYAFDVMGNRIESVCTPRLMAVRTDERQEQENQYDAFNRLIEWLAEDVDGQSQSLFLHRQDAWTLDLLGNWEERNSTFQSDPALTVTSQFTSRNEIWQQTTAVAGGSPQAAVFEYDAAGNLRFDGEFAYQYDAWNRLVQVNQAESDGNDPQTITIGAMVKHYTYDAVGRLVRTQSPYPEPDELALARSERFYYDGIRRIQEWAVDPVLTPLGAEGDPEMEALLAECMSGCDDDLDGQSTPAVFEAAQLDDDPEPGLPNPRVDREYVWGPGGVDELLVQFDPWREMMPVIQDAGGDAIALCDLNGTSGSARVVAQFTYDPYGQVIAHEHLHAHAWLRAGHKGLFVDRLDAGVANSAGDDLPRLVAGADLLTQNRNRTGRPRLGRFLQQDPNATGLVLIAASAQGGAAIHAAVAGFGMDELYGDGANLYSYLGSNAWTRKDPLGLQWDPFAWHVDAYLAEDAGSKAAFMEQLVQGFDATLHIALQVAQLHPAVRVAIVAYHAGQGNMTPMDLVMLAGPGARALAMGYSAARSTSRAYVSAGRSRGGSSGGAAGGIPPLIGGKWPHANYVESILDIPNDYLAWPQEILRNKHGRPTGIKFRDPKNPGRFVREMEPVNHQAAEQNKRNAGGYTRYHDGTGKKSKVLTGRKSRFRVR